MAYNPSNYGFSSYLPPGGPAPSGGAYDLSSISGAADKIFAALAARDAEQKKQDALRRPSFQDFLGNFFNPQQAQSLGGPQAGWGPQALQGTAQMSPALSAVGNNPPVSTPFESPLSQNVPQGKQLLQNLMSRGPQATDNMILRPGQQERPQALTSPGANQFDTLSSPLQGQQQGLQQADPGVYQHMAAMAQAPFSMPQGQGQGQPRYDFSQITPTEWEMLKGAMPYQAQLEGVRESAQGKAEVAKLQNETKKQATILRASQDSISEINKQILEAAKLRNDQLVARINAGAKVKDDLEDRRKYTAAMGEILNKTDATRAQILKDVAGGAIQGTEADKQLQDLNELRSHAYREFMTGQASYSAGLNSARPTVVPTVQPKNPKPSAAAAQPDSSPEAYKAWFMKQPPEIQAAERAKIRAEQAAKASGGG